MAIGSNPAQVTTYFHCFQLSRFVKLVCVCVCMYIVIIEESTAQIQIPTMLNLSDITTEIRSVVMFVIVDLYA